MTETPSPDEMLRMETRRAHLLWLWTITGLVLLMVVIGGVTRLTGSGLSITDWAPFMGAIPPLTPEAWDAVFAKYQASPQYKKVNEGMTLSEFKFIFFWEYIHRLTGRLIGVVVLVPGLWFWIRNQLPRKLAIQVAIGFFLGGFQAVLGWFMVMSGLIDRPSVSHYRLASHLLLAFFILGYFVWIIRDLRPLRISPSLRAAAPDLRAWNRLFCLLLFTQILYGAFVAGLRAGYTYNTFPLMNGAFVPDAFLLLKPAILNFFENPATIQWVHRYLGKTVFVVALVLWSKSRRHLELRGLAHLLLAGVAIQFLLGVFTLLYRVPLVLGVVHQLVAAILVMIAAALTHHLTRQTIARGEFPR